MFANAARMDHAQALAGLITLLIPLSLSVFLAAALLGITAVVQGAFAVPSEQMPSLSDALGIDQVTRTPLVRMVFGAALALLSGVGFSLAWSRVERCRSAISIRSSFERMLTYLRPAMPSGFEEKVRSEFSAMSNLEDAKAINRACVELGKTSGKPIPWEAEITELEGWG